MIDHLSHFLLWRSMMVGQSRGTATEADLMHSGKYWWYDGYEGFNTDH